MKLGKDICAKVINIPKQNRDTFNELLDLYSGTQAQNMINCSPDDLVGLQKKLQAAMAIKKMIEDAVIEAEQY